MEMAVYGGKTGVINQQFNRLKASNVPSKVDLGQNICLPFSLDFFYKDFRVNIAARAKERKLNDIYGIRTWRRGPREEIFPYPLGRIPTEAI